MGQVNIEKSSEMTKHSLEVFQKMVLGFMPGGHVVDEFLNFRGNLKQKRIIDFSESVKIALEEISGKEMDSGCFTTEDFVDVFESLINKVQNTKSLYKIERFRNIMVQQIVDPIESHETLKFVHILDQLQDVDLVILLKMKENDDISYRSNFRALLT